MGTLVQMTGERAAVTMEAPDERGSL